MAFVRPSFIDDMSWEMAEVYGAVNDQILINLSRYFPYWKSGSPVPKSAFEYQATMLAQMGQINKETTRIILNGLKDADETLQKVLEQAIIEGVSKSEPGLIDAVKKGIFKPAGMPIVAPNQMRAYQLYYQQAAQKLNLVNTVMLESTKQAYQATVADIAARVQATQTALDIGTGEVVTGVSSWNQALRHSIDRMKQKGITGFIDHGNHHWSAEAYTAMDIRTTVANTARAAIWETNQNFGNDLYLVSYHNGARPLCYEWQNKVISADNRSGVTYDLDGNEIEVIPQSITSYGEAAGLFGINCRHYPIPWIPGVSLADGEPQDKETNDRVYAESQEQRKLERTIREQKRDLLMMKEMGASAEEIKAQRAKIRETDDKIDAFCAETGRARRQNREGVYTKREFPNPDTYDPKVFEHKQKDEIEDYFKNGGVQQNYTFGQLTPNTPITSTFNPQTEADFDNRITELRNKRAELFNSDSYDKKETDKLLNDIFSLEDQKKAFVEQRAREALDASATTTRPINEPEFLKGFKRFDVNNRTDEQMLEQINPNYKTGERKWRVNCQRTVAAQEMVYRGYDVTAMPFNKNDPVSDYGTRVWNFKGVWYKDPDVHHAEKRSDFVNLVNNSLSEWGNGSRGIIRVKWTREYGGNGHFMFVRNVNGKTVVTDPQTGLEVDLTEKMKKVTTSKYSCWIMRVDNREVNDNIKYAIKNRGE